MELTYSSFIKKHRIANRFKSQRKLAKAAGLNHGTISRIEDGSQKPTPETLMALVPYLPTTNLYELYVACGYYTDELGASPKSNDNQQIESEVELTDKQILKLDGQVLTQGEKERMLSFLRFIRQEHS